MGPAWEKLCVRGQGLPSPRGEGNHAARMTGGPKRRKARQSVWGVPGVAEGEQELGGEQLCLASRRVSELVPYRCCGARAG